MKIKKLVLYGFGQHENKEIDFAPGMNCIYGPNEAGKTTMKTAILHILFGFPQKNQQELRYEPKNGGKYGGCLYIEDKEFGDWMIERVRGRSSGDVSIRFDDGRTAGEDGLNQLLRGYDRQSFEAVFSFSLFQLQGLEKMDENELSRTLLASGTNGLDTLWKIESKMTKEHSELFKKAGRKPPVNQKLKEIQELELQMKKEQQKLSQYGPLLQRKQQLDEEIAALRSEEQSLHSLADRLSAAMQIAPLAVQKERLAAQLKRLPEKAFPADGIRRYEEAAGRKAQLEIKRAQLLKELQELDMQPDELRPADELRALEKLLVQESEWHKLRNGQLHGETEIRLLKKKKQQFIQRTGLSESALKQAETADVSIPRERRLEPLAAKQEEAVHQLQFLQRLLAQTEQERGQAEDRKDQLLREKPNKEIPHDETENNSKNRQLPAFAVLFIGMALGAYSVIGQQWLLTAIALLAIVCGFWLLKNTAQHRAPELSDGWQQQWDTVQASIHELDSKLQNLAQQLEQAHEEKQQAAREMKEAAAGDPFDELLTVQENFRQLRDYQDMLQELSDWQERLEKSAQQLNGISAEAEPLIGFVSDDALFERLREEAARQKQLHEKRRTAAGQSEKLTARLAEADSQLKQIDDSIAELFEAAGAEQTEAFYEAYESSRERQLLSRQLAEAESQLALYAAEQQLPGTLPELEQQKTRTAERLRIIREKMNTQVDEQAGLAHQLAELQASGTYGGLSQLLEMKKAELSQLAKQWMLRKAVSAAIQKTMSGWKEHQLPSVLERANEWFEKLTAGRYHALHLTEEGYFQAAASTQQTFAINELSQATKEQAYTAIRLALAAELLERAPFPIIMDDPFVHFDNERLSRMIDLLTELQPSHQFLYFTCHEEITEKWQDANVINLRRKVKGENSG